jgi:hypothetical protein
MLKISRYISPKSSLLFIDIWTLLGDEKKRFRELLSDLAPHPAPDVPESETMLSKALTTVHLYANLANNQILDLERQGIGQMRFQIQGEKAFAVVQYPLVADLAAGSCTASRQSDEDIFAYQKRIIANLHAESLQVLHSKGHTIFRGTLKPGNFLYVPAGCYLLEKSLGTNLNIGLRSAHIDGREAAADSFNALRQAVATINPDQPLCRFWEKVATLCSK